MLRPNDLDPHQHRTIRFCRKLDSSYVAMEMGLGKTVCALTLVTLWLNEMSCHAVLYVAPINICLTVVQQEIDQWTHLRRLKCVLLHGKDKEALLNEPADVFMINPEGIKWLHATLHKRLKWRQPLFPFNGLIIDEGTKFKGRGVAWRKLKSMAPIFNKRLVMSGRPSPNSLLELWAQIYLLDSGKRLGQTYTGFRRDYFDANMYTHQFTIKPGHDTKIHDKVKDIMLAIDPATVKLPGIRTKRIVCELSDVMMKQYKRFQKQKILELKSGTIHVRNAMAMTIKLRQFCQGLIYDKTQQRSIHSVHTLKYEALRAIIDSIGDSPLMIVYNFNHERDFLLDRLPRSEYIGGGVSKPERVSIIKRWNEGKIRFLLIHPKSGSHGLNMQFGGHRLVFYSPTWSGDEYHQLIARLRRKGQTSGYVIVYQLIIKGTIELAMYGSISSKDATHENLIKSILEYADGT